ncbi:MAG: MotA/TolQ/ExbB proton channel family protein [Candidatus Hydrogenedentes bacterium]|nr:MotA/TolQ/ExbB proton channel family protein [Candidatus Hydrogenedentota bacterium]
MKVRIAGIRLSHRQLLRIYAVVLLLIGASAGLQAIAQDPPPATPAPEVTTPQPAPAATTELAPAAAPSPSPAPNVQADAAPPQNDTLPGSIPGRYEPLTLWDMLWSGGPVMAIIVLLSVIAVVMSIYLLITVTPGREVPAQFTKRAQAQIRAGDLRGAYQMCEDRDEFIANVLRAGLKRHGHDRYVIQEAMESEGERGATALWQRISYLNNIGNIAPLLGLLGTVTGMIGAFSAIAYNDSQSKSIVMAYYVAQAMITTAGGLIVAIPCYLMYYYLRGRVIKIIAEVEAQAAEFIELVSGRAPE